MSLLLFEPIQNTEPLAPVPMDTAVVELAARSLLAAPAPFATLAALEKLPASELYHAHMI